MLCNSAAVSSSAPQAQSKSSCMACPCSPRAAGTLGTGERALALAASLAQCGSTRLALSLNRRSAGSDVLPAVASLSAAATRALRRLLEHGRLRAYAAARECAEDSLKR
jgi:hypothetical protein